MLHTRDLPKVTHIEGGRVGTPTDASQVPSLCFFPWLSLTPMRRGWVGALWSLQQGGRQWVQGSHKAAETTARRAEPGNPVEGGGCTDRSLRRKLTGMSGRQQLAKYRVCLFRANSTRELGPPQGGTLINPETVLDCRLLCPRRQEGRGQRAGV